MHPTDHISIEMVYALEFNMISGARYQRVATYSVRGEIKDTPQIERQGEIKDTPQIGRHGNRRTEAQIG